MNGDGRPDFLFSARPGRAGPEHARRALSSRRTAASISSRASHAGLCRLDGRQASRPVRARNGMVPAVCSATMGGAVHRRDGGSGAGQTHRQGDLRRVRRLSAARPSRPVRRLRSRSQPLSAEPRRRHLCRRDRRDRLLPAIFNTASSRSATSTGTARPTWCSTTKDRNRRVLLGNPAWVQP